MGECDGRSGDRRAFASQAEEEKLERERHADIRRKNRLRQGTSDLGTMLRALMKSSPELITSSILCTPREPSSIGTSVRVWKKVNSPKPVKISLPLRRITKRSVLRPPRVKVKRKAWSDQASTSCLQSKLRASSLNFTLKRSVSC